MSEGNELTPTQVKDQPTLEWYIDPNSYYTLLMTNPDAPSRADPKIREVRHWLVGNIPSCDVAKGDAIVEYVGPGPPKDTGLHRYIFLIFKQSDKIVFEETRATNR